MDVVSTGKLFASSVALASHFCILSDEIEFILCVSESVLDHTDHVNNYNAQCMCANYAYSLMPHLPVFLPSVCHNSLLQLP